MFGFSKKKRLIEGPIDFTSEVEIDRSSAEVFPLIDIADARFCHAQRGAKIAPVQGEEGRYDLTIEEMEGVTFQFRVLENVPGALHKLECIIEPRINDLTHSVELYRIESIGEAACRVELTTTATFDESLSDEEVAEEIATMSAAVNMDLLKLKVLAEDGLEAVEAMDDDPFDGIEIEGFEFGEIDLSDLK